MTLDQYSVNIVFVVTNEDEKQNSPEISSHYSSHTPLVFTPPNHHVKEEQFVSEMALGSLPGPC